LKWPINHSIAIEKRPKWDRVSVFLFFTPIDVPKSESIQFSWTNI